MASPSDAEVAMVMPFGFTTEEEAAATNPMPVTPTADDATYPAASRESHPSSPSMPTKRKAADDLSDESVDNLSKEETRKLKNRISAAKSRHRTQQRMRQLEDRVTQLQRQNAYLNKMVMMLSHRNHHAMVAQPEAIYQPMLQAPMMVGATMPAGVYQPTCFPTTVLHQQQQTLPPISHPDGSFADAWSAAMPVL
ncbi:TPA: hypothetical protein N0F65_001699 [Lagenidium giganteum]|uniref:X-box-binding protein 1 n=1 Tax=Lagenidium giganteum TaxID=4803 RepID=A0AAV2YPA7_9STRA|nr:TPA: hypothetical protein N0F65_001699 [Lagenidium giganteum]